MEEDYIIFNSGIKSYCAVDAVGIYWSKNPSRAVGFDLKKAKSMLWYIKTLYPYPKNVKLARRKVTVEILEEENGPASKSV